MSLLAAAAASGFISKRPLRSRAASHRVQAEALLGATQPRRCRGYKAAPHW